MTVVNGYASLANFKTYITPPGQSLSIDTADDGVIDSIIARASRRVDDLCGRKFYPRIATRYYNTPPGNELWLDDDLLEIITLTNGDTVAIASTDYVLKPTNEYPKYAIRLKDMSTIYFTLATDSSADEAISLAAVWGYRDRYNADGWVTGSTLNEGAGLNATDLTFTVTAGTLFARDQIIRIENELMIVSLVSTNDITVTQRGVNGSTAATHANGTAVKYWVHQDDIQALALEITRIMYRARYGENVETTAITTPAGVIVTPRSLPTWAQEIIRKYQRLV